MEVFENKSAKWCRSETYNYNFNKVNGLFMRWGKTLEEDPIMAPSCEIADIEITNDPDCLGKCRFCYKCNGVKGLPKYNMSLDTFKTLFSKFPKILCQIAFGICDIHSNPDFFSIMEHSRSNGVIPNYTCHGLDVDDAVAKRTAELCGAVAVSVVRLESTYDSVKKFTDAGMKQVNIHYMLSQESFPNALKVVDDIASDARLEGLRAIVFLQCKPKGLATGHFTPIQDESKYRELIDYCESKHVNYGFDSCSAPLYLRSIRHRPDYDKLAAFVDPYEACLQSCYCNSHGEFFPCSFAEGTPGWEKGINVLDCEDFIKDVWNHERVQQWRARLINSSKTCDKCQCAKICRSCPIYPVTACKKTK